MRKILRFFSLLLLLGTMGFDTIQQSPSTPPSSEKPTVFVFKIHEGISAPAWRVTKNALEQAREKEADLILLNLNTYGGRVDYADSIRTALLNAGMPTIVFINKNAASAGALISIACDNIYMTNGATIGAATVVSQRGKKMPDKYQSYMRAKMRATAETQGRDPNIAEAMVDAEIEIEGIIEKGNVLTFTTEEAIQHGFCEGRANSINEVLQLAGVKNYTIVHHEISTIHQIIQFFVNPAVSGLLLMGMLMGLYMEMQSPGLGFPGIVALGAAILYFTPLYIEGLAQNWEILIFIAGLILIALELFVVPGFGVTGISGIFLIFGSLILALIRNDVFDFTYVPNEEVLEAVLQVFIPISILIILLSIYGGSFFRSAYFQRLVLQDTESTQEGYTTGDASQKELIGKKGKVVTRLNPAGKVEIEGEQYDCVAEGAYVDIGETVQVIDLKSHYIVVDKIYEA